MRQVLNAFLAFALAFSVPFSVPAAAETPIAPKFKSGDPLPANLFVELAKTVNPAVVNIFTTYLPRGRGGAPRGGDPQRDPFYELFEQFMGPQRGGPANPQQSLGTGFIIREDGLIITNNHVVDKADVIKVQITENTKESFDAKVIGRDARTDIALIKIDAKKKLPFVKLGNSSEVQVGEWVAAFGNPYGYGHTMTKGIISAVGREIDELNLFPFMQTDASINPGNSGGPLVNTQGQVIGVNTAIDARAQGIGFVIPIDNVKSLLPELEKSGGIDRGFIGVQMADLNEDDAKSLNIKDSEGALIMQVIPGTPAEKAGIQPYDLITEFNGKKITNTKDLVKQVASTSSGKSVPVKLVRNGKTRNVQLTVGSADKAEIRVGGRDGGGGGPKGGLKAPFELGFMVTDYTPQMSQQFGLPRLKQAKPIVIAVDPESEAGVKGLAPGDVILDINRESVSKAKDAMKLIKKGSINVFRVLRPDRVVLISLRA